MSAKKVTVIGSGGWGTALALVAYAAGNDVTLWSAFKQEIDEIAAYGENKLLPGIVIPRDMRLSYKYEDISDSEICIVAVPSVVIRKVVSSIKEYVNPSCIVVNVSKGLEEGSLLRLSQVIEQELPNNVVVALSGPSHAEEVARGVPTTVVAASADMDAAKTVQATLTAQNFRIYTNPDIIGVELGGTIKNVIALAAGICDGIGCGDNTKAALMTRGINEIGYLGIKMGAKSATFAGLAGIGDLIVTCTSMHSRNRRAGILIGQGCPPEEAVRKVGTVEGFFATKTVYELAQREGVELPIVEQCYRLLFEGISPETAIRTLMNRPAGEENMSNDGIG